ncbi:HAMP domain-containing histidine kinase [Amycolatopsis acidicola]|uniref:histidine kinase n=1 Tax=Amycolatopsis acidicola TaxID=2596893 RepID=A0A5N0V1Q2_9PSEU|nr:HAMP domain-containing sensor histidine kinase [Amycolatopsis acidicola]KAA9158092.1 HAMP domain-containing histidine kinase [Amycolatopsis acidicola]
MRRRADPAEARLVRRTMVRIALQSTLAVAVTVALLIVVAVLAVLRGQHDDQDSLLASAIAHADDVSDPPAGTWLVISADGRVQASPGLPHGLPDRQELARVAAGGPAATVDYRMHDREYRVRTETHGDGVVQAVLDMRSAHEERDRLLQALVIAGLAGLALAALTGAWMARRAVTPLVESLALQRRFVADAGHELRTPLTLLSTRAQLLRRKLRAGPHESDVDGLVDDANQLAAILDDLLLAADPREEIPRQPVELNALVRQAVAAAEPAAAEQEVRLVFEPGAEVWVDGYEAGLRRAVNALLDNGIRHATAELRVGLSRSGRNARLDFSDDGPGIDEAVLPDLFTRFASGPAPEPGAARRRYGLGLSLVSEIAARHGGAVSARNVETGGARISVLLPVLSAS